MKNCLFFAENAPFSDKAPACPELPALETARLAAGFGFTAAGLWRELPPPAWAAGLVVDDRCLPDARGLAAARRVLETWEGLLVFDLERPVRDELAVLLRALDGKAVAVPPAYAELPHEAILSGPWAGGRRFSDWLSAQRERYGTLLLDAAPIRCRVRPGKVWQSWEAPLPEAGFPCPGSGFLHRRLPDGSLVFWDTKRTLADRLRAANIPAVVFSDDWGSLPDA